jgi:hypothetical protein
MMYHVAMENYEQIRQHYRPDVIKFLLIAESPPPPAAAEGSRHFYRTDRVRPDDRLFLNTVKALYPELASKTDTEIEQNKEAWLRRLQTDGIYMIEALETSMRHEVSKKQRQENIRQALPRLVERVRELADDQTGLILIKSNVNDVAAGPLRQAGFKVLNDGLVDYPGHYNQAAYRQKLAKLVSPKPEFM